MSSRLVLPAHLRSLAGGAAYVDCDGTTLRGVLDDLAVRWPVLERRLRDERGSLRPHVLVFVDGTGVRGAGELDTPVRDGAEVFVAPAVSGGQLGAGARSRDLSEPPPRRGAGCRSRPGGHRLIQTR